MEEVHLRHTLALIAENAVLWMTPSCSKPGGGTSLCSDTGLQLCGRTEKERLPVHLEKTSLNVPEQLDHHLDL